MGYEFEKRFNIPITFEEARVRFVNRIHAAMLDELRGTDSTTYELRRSVATILGEQFKYGWGPSVVSRDFVKTLRAAEATLEACGNDRNWWNAAGRFSAQISGCVEQAETDLGVRFDGKRFHPTGAKLLDAELVNDPLDWCRRKGLEKVVKPFEKALNDLLDGHSKPDRRIDAVAAAYEAVEAMAKHVTKGDKPLSGLREEFTSKLGISKSADKMVAEFVDWACTYRHSEKADRPKPQALGYPEAEGLIYQAGLIIRMAIKCTEAREGGFPGR